MEFDGNPKTKALAETVAMESNECLRLFTLKMKERNYLDNIMKRLNAEMSPFRDESSRDPVFTREMWQIYQT